MHQMHKVGALCSSYTIHLPFGAAFCWAPGCLPPLSCRLWAVSGLEPLLKASGKVSLSVVADLAQTSAPGSVVNRGVRHTVVLSREG